MAQPERALRAAALWHLPLLIEGQPEGEPETLNPFAARRHPVIGVHLPSGAQDLAVREVTLQAAQPDPGSAHLQLDDGKASTPADQPVTHHALGVEAPFRYEAPPSANAACGACATNRAGASTAWTSTGGTHA